MSDVPCFIGIDVAKAQLDIAVRPSGERWAVPNDAIGVTTLVDQLQARHPTLIVLEATGGLERAVTSALATAGRWSLSTRDRYAILPGPRANSPKRTPWMPAPWPMVPT